MDQAHTSDGTDGERGLARLNALSDGVFAIAMTLLVLDVSVPPELSDTEFHQRIGETVPNLAAYAVSFYVLAQFWRDHRYVLGRLRTVDSKNIHQALIGLGLIALVPFPTALLAEYGVSQPLATVSYALLTAAINAMHLALLRGTWDARHRPDAVERLAAVDLACSAAVFMVSVPVAFLSPVAAMAVWVVLLPCKVVVGVRQNRAQHHGAQPID